MKSPHFISVAVALLLCFVQPSAQAVSAIPDEVEYITLYTQLGKEDVLYPYVIRFGDETGVSIQKKQAKKVFKRLKKTPVDSFQFEGFELVSVGNMADDAAAQHASAAVKRHGLHDYGNRNTPVYYFERKK